jgi:hypothetical protein
MVGVVARLMHAGASVPYGVYKHSHIHVPHREKKALHVTVHMKLPMTDIHSPLDCIDSNIPISPDTQQYARLATNPA